MRQKEIICDLAQYYDFNPRTPYGMRHSIDNLRWATYSISIHAPLTGCDTAMTIGLHVYKEFQSTHPLRDATGGF